MIYEVRIVKREARQTETTTLIEHFNAKDINEAQIKGQKLASENKGILKAVTNVTKPETEIGSLSVDSALATILGIHPDLTEDLLLQWLEENGKQYNEWKIDRREVDKAMLKIGEGIKELYGIKWDTFNEKANVEEARKTLVKAYNHIVKALQLTVTEKLKKLEE